MPIWNAPTSWSRCSLNGAYSMKSAKECGAKYAQTPNTSIAAALSSTANVTTTVKEGGRVRGGAAAGEGQAPIVAVAPIEGRACGVLIAPPPPAPGSARARPAQ